MHSLRKADVLQANILAAAFIMHCNRFKLMSVGYWLFYLFLCTLLLLFGCKNVFVHVSLQLLLINGCSSVTVCVHIVNVFFACLMVNVCWFSC